MRTLTVRTPRPAPSQPRQPDDRAKHASLPSRTNTPFEKEREKRVPSVEPFGMLPTARSARSVSAFYSIAVRDTKERARDKGGPGQGVGLRPPRGSSSFRGS